MIRVYILCISFILFFGSSVFSQSLPSKPEKRIENKEARSNSHFTSCISSHYESGKIPQSELDKMDGEGNPLPVCQDNYSDHPYEPLNLYLEMGPGEVLDGINLDERNYLVGIKMGPEPGLRIIKNSTFQFISEKGLGIQMRGKGVTLLLIDSSFTGHQPIGHDHLGIGIRLYDGAQVIVFDTDFTRLKYGAFVHGGSLANIHSSKFLDNNYGILAMWPFARLTVHDSKFYNNNVGIADITSNKIGDIPSIKNYYTDLFFGYNKVDIRIWKRSAQIINFVSFGREDTHCLQLGSHEGSPEIGSEAPLSDYGIQTLGVIGMKCFSPGANPLTVDGTVPWIVRISGLEVYGGDYSGVDVKEWPNGGHTVFVNGKAFHSTTESKVWKELGKE